MTQPSNQRLVTEDKLSDQLTQLLQATSETYETITTGNTHVVDTDTGWVNSAIIPGANMANYGAPEYSSDPTAYGARIHNGILEYRFQFDFNGSSVTAGSDGNLSDQGVGTITDSRFLVPATTQFLCSKNGYPGYVARAYTNVSGTTSLSIVAGTFAGQVLDNTRTSLLVDVMWLL